MYITEKVSSVGASIWNGNIDKGVACRVWLIYLSFPKDIFLIVKTQSHLAGISNLKKSNKERSISKRNTINRLPL